MGEKWRVVGRPQRARGHVTMFGKDTIVNNQARSLSNPNGSRTVAVDLAAVTLSDLGPRLRRAAWRLGDGESRRVKVAGISWPALADLRSEGFTYRLLSMNGEGAELAVWRRYTDDERRRYLREPLRPRPGYPRNAHRKGETA